MPSQAFRIGTRERTELFRPSLMTYAPGFIIRFASLGRVDEGQGEGRSSKESLLLDLFMVHGACSRLDRLALEQSFCTISLREGSQGRSFPTIPTTPSSVASSVTRPWRSSQTPDLAVIAGPGRYLYAACNRFHLHRRAWRTWYEGGDRAYCRTGWLESASGPPLSRSFGSRPLGG